MTDDNGNYLVYRNGVYRREDPIEFTAADNSERCCSEVLETRGYHRSQDVGDTSGLSYTLWEHHTEGWVVNFGTACRFCCIHVADWPDLIDLLHKLSIIALAGLITEDYGYHGVYFPVRETHAARRSLSASLHSPGEAVRCRRSARRPGAVRLAVVRRARGVPRRGPVGPAPHRVGAPAGRAGDDQC